MASAGSALAEVSGGTGTERLFQADAYSSTVEARLIEVRPDLDGTGHALVFDRTNFFAEGGGQPGDTGFLETEDGTRLSVIDTVYAEDGNTILMRCDASEPAPPIGQTIILHVDWKRRYRLMRMHTACHLLTVVCPYPITGARVGEEESRIDFDSGDAALDKTQVTAALMELVAANHPVFTRWVSEAELTADPGLVKSKNVRPPSGTGQIRLVCIGADGAIDTQPCGGTHVLETAEIGEVHIGKIEKKGRENRRLRIRFGPLPG